MNPTVGDIAGNTDIVLRRIEEARAAQADLVALPELMLTGYPPEDLLLKPSFIRDNIAALERVVAASKGIAVVVGFVNSEGNQVYNAAAVAHNGKLAGIYHKVYLPNYGVFDEDRYFKPGRVCPVYTINGVAVGVNICEDIWYALGPVPLQREAGAEVIVNINGSPFHAGKFASRERMLGTRAADQRPLHRLRQHRRRPGRAGLRRRQRGARRRRSAGGPGRAVPGGAARRRPRCRARLPPPAPRSPRPQGGGLHARGHRPHGAGPRVRLRAHGPGHRFPSA